MGQNGAKLCMGDNIINLGSKTESKLNMVRKFEIGSKLDPHRGCGLI